MTVAPGGALAWLRLMRAPAVFTAVSNIVAAHLVATGGQVEWTTLVLLSLASCSLYVGGMILNDCFDSEVDAIERPERPIPSRAVDRRSAWIVGFAALLAGIALAAAAGTVALMIAALLALAILSYDGWTKNSVFGPFNMALCRALNWMLGLSVLTIGAESLLFTVPISLYVLALTLISRVEVHAQSRGPVMLALIVMLAAGLAYGQWVGQAAPDLLLGLVFFGLAVVCIGMALRAFGPAMVQRTVGWLLLGIIPLDALLVASTGQWLGACGVLLLLLPGRMLGRWMYVT